MGVRVNRFFLLSHSHPDRPRQSTGPYAFVRHPGYTAGILIMVASGPALGSWLATALVVIFSLPFLLYRAITEDQILQAELADHSDYPRGSNGGFSSSRCWLASARYVSNGLYPWQRIMK
jgi:protein-S-isoprenylcysteine O-methyltransferase Ste14